VWCSLGFRQFLKMEWSVGDFLWLPFEGVKVLAVGLVDAIASAYPCELLCNTRESLRHPELSPRRRDEEKR